ncbi:pyridoxamine phosphate oxidase, putative [Talaromyces stipitatus ATCC 10500]|uniref:lipoyl(octanoyl) transferase n=1 Tax=Talaromyces stipitatus (strain ATCC 10500 / CBS 375.48 / QM 6759 / NRRL 1006) TaxID=441959 RepID=B8MMU8_TALSN|nr:pyridoxamine phosphate oxidase, putative [Talaromyces stipitatus ATCC 10500]EED13854.1 pyridoxamine phosphate oxidase, putative [Talaromyces stipitatus ATCC 10500]
MADRPNPPLSYEPSATTTHPHVGSSLLPEVVACLKNSRYLHLATCDGLTPHVSLMSYTYLSETPFDAYPVIIMTTNPSSKKTLNLEANPRVSLLVHDWVSHRPPTRAPNGRDGSPPPAATRSSLASLLLNLNTSALSSISTTITGTARFLEVGSEEEKWCKNQHLENNTFVAAPNEEMPFGQQRRGSGVAETPMIDDNSRVVIVQVREGRIADWKGGVRDWQLVRDGPQINEFAPLILIMRLAHLHLPNITPFNTVSQIQQTLTLRHLAYKKAVSTPTSTSTIPPDPTIITFTPNPVYTTGRRDLPPSNTSSPSDPTPSLELSLPPSLEPIRHLLDPTQPSPSSSSSSSSGQQTRKAEYHPTLRGGQTTYHGPGQLVAYTILDLRRLGLSPRCHISLLERSVIDLLDRYRVRGFTTSDPGVWVASKDDGEARKITAVGVHLRRHISSYGIGLNVTQEPMWFFKQIVACGLEGKEATSLEGEGVTFPSEKMEEEVMSEVADGFVDSFVRRLEGDFPVGKGGRRDGVESVYKIGIEDVGLD